MEQKPHGEPTSAPPPVYSPQVQPPPPPYSVDMPPQQYSVDAGYPKQAGYPQMAQQPAYPPAGSVPMAQVTVVTQPAPVMGMSSGYGEHPVNMSCPYCHENVTTYTAYVSGTLAWLACAAMAVAGLFLIIPFFLCCVPFCLPVCKDVEHYCPACKRLLGTFRRM